MPPESKKDEEIEKLDISQEPVKKEVKEFTKPEISNGNGTKTKISASLKPIINLSKVGVEEEAKPEDYHFEEEEKYFSKEEVDSAIQNYKEALKSKGKNGESRLFDNKYTLLGNKITLQIDNPVDEVRFNDIKSDLHLYLRRKLQNKRVSFEIEMMAVEKKKMIYTPQEKFDHLAKKNPALIELKNRLGLEFEF